MTRPHITNHALLRYLERFVGIDAQKTQAGIPTCVLATPRPFDQGIGQPQPRWQSVARAEHVA